MNKILKSHLFLIPSFLVVLIFIFIPWIISLIESFKVINPIHAREFKIDINNFSDAVNSTLFKTSFFNSNILVFVAMPIGMIISLFFAFLLYSFTSLKFKKFISSTLFSQFFISLYAIGISFFFLFGTDKEVINYIFGTKIDFLDDFKGHTSLFTLSIFLIWRLFSFNVVFMYFALAKISIQQKNIAFLDNLIFINKFKFLYLPALKRSLILLLYINFFEAMFLLPDSIFNTDRPADVEIFNGSTLSHFLFSKRGSLKEIKIVFAASIIIFLWVIAIISSFTLSFFLYKKYSHKFFIKRIKYEIQI